MNIHVHAQLRMPMNTFAYTVMFQLAMSMECAGSLLRI